MRLACDTFLIVTQEAFYRYPTRYCLLHSPSMAGGLGFSFITLSNLNINQGTTNKILDISSSNFSDLIMRELLITIVFPITHSSDANANKRPILKRSISFSLHKFLYSHISPHAYSCTLALLPAFVPLILTLTKFSGIANIGNSALIINHIYTSCPYRNSGLNLHSG